MEIFGLSLSGWITILVFLGVFLSLLLTKVKAEVVFFLTMALLCITGVLDFETSFGGFASASVLLIGILYIVIAGLKHSGALEWIVSHLMGLPRGHVAALLRLMIPVSLISSCMSNTAATALFQSVVRQWAEKLRIPASKLLIPLAYSATIGGLLTLIGTPPNLIISGLYAKDSGVTMNLLTPLPVGLAVLAVSVATMILLRNRLPVRTPGQNALDSQATGPVVPVRKTYLSLLLLALMLITSSLNILPLAICCLIAGILMVVFRCCSADQAFQEVDFKVLIIFAGSICLGTAMEKSGVASLIVDNLLGICGSNPYVVLTAICLVGAVMTEMISDTGCAALFYPIAMQAATALDVNPVTFLVALMMSASNSFATPIATPPNMIVFASGGYRFGDFARIGLILKVVTLATIILVTTLVYPFN